jgi:hypothetical protein
MQLCILKFKNFSGVIPRTPFKEEGKEEGKDGIGKGRDRKGR